MTPARATQEKLYRELAGDDALARQKREAARKCDTCLAPLRFGRDGDKWVPLDYDTHEGGNWFLFDDSHCYQGRQEDETPPGATRHYKALQAFGDMPPTTAGAGAARVRLRLWKKAAEPSAREQRDTWIEWMRLDGKSESTITGYRQLTDRFLKQWPDLLMSEVGDDIITGFIEEAHPKSRQQRRGAFANWFGWGFRTKRIPRDVMRFVPTYKAPRRDLIETFTDAECKILCALPEPDGTLMALLLGSGIRKAEARHLKVRRIDFEHDELHIVEGAKGGSVGIVPLSRVLMQRLAEYVLLEGLNADDYLWYCHPGGTPIRRHDRAIADGAMHKWWVAKVTAAGIPYKHLHTTRHTYAAELRRRGASYDDVGFVLRHADPRTTKIVYAHTQIYDVRRRLEALAAEAVSLETERVTSEEVKSA